MLKMSRLENQAMVIKHEVVQVDEQIRKVIIVLSEKYAAPDMEYDIKLPKLQVEAILAEKGA